MNGFCRLLIASLLGLATAGPTLAVEGGLGAYLLGSRGSFSGIVPGPGLYVGLDIVHSEGSVKGLVLGGFPIRADTKIKLNFAKLSVTKVFNAQLWGGTPAVNINIPYVINASIAFIGQIPPITGEAIHDATSGLGDITLTPMVGWHKGKLHQSVALSVFVPTGSFHTASIDLPAHTINALNTGKNIWSLQPVYAVTHFDPSTGLELSGTASFLISTRNKATDYQNAQRLIWRARYCSTPNLAGLLA